MEPRIPDGPARRPLIRSSVRLAARPRRPTVSAPRPPLAIKADDTADVIWLEPEIAVDVCRRPPRSAIPSIFASSTVKTSIETGDENSSRRIREPVTTTSSLTLASSSSTTSCAIALESANTEIADVASNIPVNFFIILPFMTQPRAASPIGLLCDRDMTRQSKDYMHVMSAVLSRKRFVSQQSRTIIEHYGCISASILERESP